MCYHCYKEKGKPLIITDKTIAATKLIDKVYGHDIVGGNAHIVVDDWNLEDDNIRWCLKNMEDGTPRDQKRAETECLQALLALSMEGRASAMAIHEGYITRETEK